MDCSARIPPSRPWSLPSASSYGPTAPGASTPSFFSPNAWSVTSLFSAYASFTAFMMMFRSVRINDFIPAPLQSFLWWALQYLFPSLFRSFRTTTIVVERYFELSRNQVYDAAEVYLGTKISPTSDMFKVHKTPRQQHLSTSLEESEEIIDIYHNMQFKWIKAAPSSSSSKSTPHSGGGGRRTSFHLTFDKGLYDKALNEYLPFVLARAKEIKSGEKKVKLYSLSCPKRMTSGDEVGDEPQGNWGSITLEHPSTFDTLAMEPEMKRALIEDLDRFVKRREYYKRVGKAWKRGYLLYGPPGTGKSSLIAAMANYLMFDIYDLELTSFYSNKAFRKTLLTTTNRSIVVIEDIDCSAEMHTRHQYPIMPNQLQGKTSSKKLTLSGLLNFIDGLWSSCGDERIIIFTTNHKDRLDPALLRPGRMDMHIHMSYCKYHGFRLLASNYLGIDYDQGHKLFEEIQVLLEEVQVTPAEIAEELMKSEDVNIALEGFVTFMKRKKMERKDAEEEKADEEKPSPSPVFPNCNPTGPLPEFDRIDSMSSSSESSGI